MNSAERQLRELRRGAVDLVREEELRRTRSVRKFGGDHSRHLKVTERY